MYTRRTDLKYEPGWVGLGWVHEDARGGDTPHHLQPRQPYEDPYSSRGTHHT